MRLISTGLVNQRAGRADLDAAPAFDTGAIPKRYVVISNDHAVCAAFSNRQSEVPCHLRAGAHTTAAQNATVVIQYEVWMRCVYYKIVPGWLNGPIRHFFVVGGILQFTIPATDLTERTEVIALTEQHRQDEFPRFPERLGFSTDDHAVIDWQSAGCHRHPYSLHLHDA